MLKRIEKLTPEQEAQMPGWADKWITQGLKTGETDWGKGIDALERCYHKAEIEWHGNVVKVQSPIVGALAASHTEAILRSGAVGDAVSGAVDDAVSGAVRDVVNGAVSDAVGGAVDAAVRGAVDGAVGGAVDGDVGVTVRDAVGDAVGGAVGDAVGGAVDDAVGGAVNGAVHIAVDGAVDGAVYDAVRGPRLKWHHWLGGQFWAGWWGSSAYTSFFVDVCGLELDQDIQERYLAYRDLNESVNYIWPNQSFAMICARPSHILRDEQGRLHSDQKQAIEYPDGWGLYMLHGVRFEKDVWTKIVNQEFRLGDMASIENADQRGIAFQMSNPQNLIKESGATLLDSGHAHNHLYECPPQEGLFDDTQYFVHIEDMWTNREFIEWVNPEVARETRSCDAVVADQFGVTVEQWKATQVHA